MCAHQLVYPIDLRLEVWRMMLKNNNLFTRFTLNSRLITKENIIMASNASYSYNDVLTGKTGAVFKASQDDRYSKGVEDLQKYLRLIGYTIKDTRGRYQDDTVDAVTAFQHELGITEDGVAGNKTVVRLEAARTSEYYEYGGFLEESEWGQDNILSGNFDDIDLLARIIYAEQTSLTDDQTGVAMVIRNRCGTSFCESATAYPKASEWARVVGYKSKPMGIQYASASAGTINAQQPRRGLGGTSPDFVDPGWKNAVDLAKKLTDGTSISVSGYKVTGTTIGTTRASVGSQLHQVAWSHYVSVYNAGNVNTSVNVIAFSGKKDGNVVFTMK